MSQHNQYFERKRGSKRDGGWYKLITVLPPTQLLHSIQVKQPLQTESFVNSQGRKRPYSDLQVSQEKPLFFVSV